MASESGKKISKTTLGLRFMQNALRAKQQQETELEQATVKGEAEWEIDTKSREAWGGQLEQFSKSSVTYEPSYLPFMFPSLQSKEDTSRDEFEASSSVVPLARGRRKFNKKGQEVALEEPIKQPEEVAETPTSDFPIGERPVSVSGFGATKLRSDKADGKRRADAPANVSVLKMLSGETSQAVGVDLRASRTSLIPAGSFLDIQDSDVKSKIDDARMPKHDGSRLSVKSAAGSSKSTSGPKSGPPVFMRPASVDSPASKHKQSAEKRARAIEDESSNSNSRLDSQGESGRRKKKRKDAGSKSDVVKSVGEAR